MTNAELKAVAVVVVARAQMWLENVLRRHTQQVVGWGQRGQRYSLSIL